MSAPRIPIEEFDRWYKSLRIHKVSGGPARGTISAALIVLERLKADCRLELSAHTAPGGSQIQGTSGPAASKILARFGESRPFLREGGRTNRGLPEAIEGMLQALRRLGLCEANRERRVEILEELQQYLIKKIREWHGRQRLSFSFDARNSTWHIVHDLLESAAEVGKEGPVAQYLVGAKLQIRHPNVSIENYSSTTSDAQQGRAGDFLVEDTAFHVTVSPMTGVYERCKSNIRDGLSVYLLVPDRSLQGARQIAEATERGRIFVESIESFVGGNMNEMSVFNRRAMIDQFRMLLQLYNDRVDKVETDKSIMIEIPAALLRDG